jgi:hypothetical protein
VTVPAYRLQPARRCHQKVFLPILTASQNFMQPDIERGETISIQPLKFTRFPQTVKLLK